MKIFNPTVSRRQVDEIIRIVTSWDHITTEPHRFGGTEFVLDTTEIGHIHNNGLLDIPFSRAIREILVKNGNAKPHHILPETGWISFYTRDTGASIDEALKLLRLSYLFRLKRRKTVAIDFEEELKKLNFGEEISTLIK